MDYIFFINRSGDDVSIGNMSSHLNRFENLTACYGRFENDTVYVPPYSYTIINAKFVK